MKLTSRSEYALLALIHLARQDRARYVTVHAIAEAQDIPLRFLQHILLTLKRAGIVRSLKGQRGGYQLGRPAKNIDLAAVVRLFDGALAPTESVSRYFYEPTPIEREKKALSVFRKVRDCVAHTLERTSLADVA